MPLTEAQIAYETEHIPYTPVKRLERGPFYVRVQDIPHPIYGYSQYHKEYSVIDLRGYRKGMEPRLEILGVYTPNPNDLFRIGTGRLPPYQPTTTGDKLQAEMEKVGSFHAWRILPETTSPLPDVSRFNTQYSTKQLQTMAKGATISPTGLKEDLIRRLVEKGILK